MLEENKLPQGWLWTELKQITNITMGQSPPSKTYNDKKNGLPFYQGKSDFGEYYPKPTTWCSRPQKIANKNDILMSVRAPVGPTNVANEKCCIGRGLAAITPLGGISTWYVLSYLRLVEKKISGMGSGSTFTAINRSDLESIQIPIAPLEEQKYIVSKIEELFKENRITQQTLNMIPKIMKKFRQSVLASAFRGDLVPQDPNDEPAEKRWNLTIPPLVDTELPSIPDNWCYRKINDISKRVSVGYVGPTSKYYCDPDDGIQFIRSQNVRPLKLDFKGIQYITREFHEKIKKSQLLTGDLLIVRVGANRGDTCIVPKNTGQLNCANIVFARPYDGISEYLEFYFQSNYCQRELGKLTTGSAQGVINTKSVAKIPIPIPPEKEQERLMKKITELFSFANKIEKLVEETKKRSDKIDQTILAKAFKGELVIQDPNDEPASVLLERIKHIKEK